MADESTAPAARAKAVEIREPWAPKVGDRVCVKSSGATTGLVETIRANILIRDENYPVKKSDRTGWYTQDELTLIHPEPPPPTHADLAALVVVVERLVRFEQQSIYDRTIGGGDAALSEEERGESFRSAMKSRVEPLDAILAALRAEGGA